MELTSRQLEFLQAELREILNSDNRDQEAVKIATEILESVDRELKVPDSASVQTVTIDRESNSGNLIAQEDSHIHIRANKVGGRTPQPGEKWRVFEAKSTHSITKLEPIEHLKTIDGYTSNVPHDQGDKQSTKDVGEKRETDVEIDEDMEVSEEQDKHAASNYRMTRDDPKSSVAGSKNDLLKGSR